MKYCVWLLAFFFLKGCAYFINEIVFVVPNDFRGPITVRAKADIFLDFNGQIVVQESGEIEVSESSFHKYYTLAAHYIGGSPIEVGLLSDEAAANDFALWELPSGVNVAYFYVGTREQASNWYHENAGTLYIVEENHD